MPTDNSELTYDPELAAGYYIQIRSDFLRSPAFTPIAKVLYEVLLTYAAEKATAWPGQARLARECAVSEPTIRRALGELRAATLVTQERRGLNLTNRYHLHKLATLPAHAGTKKSFVPMRKNFPPQNTSHLRSRPEPASAKVESEETESVKIEEGPDYLQQEVSRRLERAGIIVPKQRL